MWPTAFCCLSLLHEWIKQKLSFLDEKDEEKKTEIRKRNFWFNRFIPCYNIVNEHPIWARYTCNSTPYLRVYHLSITKRIILIQFQSLYTWPSHRKILNWFIFSDENETGTGMNVFSKWKKKFFFARFIFPLFMRCPHIMISYNKIGINFSFVFVGRRRVRRANENDLV